MTNELQQYAAPLGAGGRPGRAHAGPAKVPQAVAKLEARLGKDPRVAAQSALGWCVAPLRGPQTFATTAQNQTESPRGAVVFEQAPFGNGPADALWMLVTTLWGREILSAAGGRDCED